MELASPNSVGKSKVYAKPVANYLLASFVIFSSCLLIITLSTSILYLLRVLIEFFCSEG